MRERPIYDAASFPIPRDVTPGRGWSRIMIEMATHIGAYATLLICDRFGGEEVYVPLDTARNPFAPLVGRAKAMRLSEVYGRETVAIPTARGALSIARRAGVVAAVRAGTMSVADMARTLGIRRDYASKLVNGTNEGVGTAPIVTGSAPDPRQIDMFFAG